MAEFNSELSTIHDDNVIDTTHRNIETDEKMLPVHFLPEGRKCYDWVKHDIEQEDTNSIVDPIKERPGMKAKTKLVNSVTYSSCHMSSPPSNTYEQKNIVKLILNAAENGDFIMLKELLSVNKGLINSTDNDGYTALHRASYSGHENIVLYLLEHGANISARTDDGWQPLHCAARWSKYSECP